MTARSGVARLAAAIAGLLAGTFALSAAPIPTEKPGSSGLVEETRVHRVQIDVSVIDTRRDRWASVPDLPRDAFEIRVDGKLLTGELAERADFDPVCPEPPPDRGSAARTPAAGVPTGAGDPPTLLVVVDLNFLDLQMRHNVGRALEDLARQAEERPLRVKIIAITRRLTPLMADFSSDPEEIRRAARALTEVRAGGPPRGPAPPTSSDFTTQTPPEQPYELAPELRDSAGRDSATDPDREIPAFRVTETLESSGIQAFGRTQPSLSPTYELASREVDPRPSLAALEAVMLSHAAIRGRKALVLFSSAWFDLPEELWLDYLEGPRIAAQSGFTIWSVDARGLNATSGYHSRLLGQIATSSGGEAIRSAGRLAIGFDRAIAQLSCYYLFSVPVEAPASGTEHHNVSVRLDTGRYPEFWRFRIRAPTGFTLFDPVRQRQRARLAALMEPQGHRFPEIRITGGYPDARRSYVMPVEVSVLLSDLTFTGDTAAGDLRAELAWEGVVTSSTGRQVCLLGDGRRRLVRVASPPVKHPPTMLVLRTTCALPGPGSYDVRAVLEDLVSGDIGAGTTLFQVADPGGGLAPVSAIRLGRNSGRDFLLEYPMGDELDAPRDVERRAFTPLNPGEAIVPQERLLVRFVACNDDAPPPVILYRRPQAVPGDTRRAADVLFQVSVGLRAEIAGDKGRCLEYEGIVPENTLVPGDYGLAFIDRRLASNGRDEVDRLIDGGRAGAFIEFSVTPAPAPADDETERTARRR